MTNSELPNWDAAHAIARSVLTLAADFGAHSFDGWSEWMVARLTERFADVVYREGKPTPGAIYLVPLGDHAPTPGSDDDRTCDRCGHFVPWDAADDEFYVVTITLLANVTVCGGLCAPCMALEAPQG